MKSDMRKRVWVAAILVCAVGLAAGPAMAQQDAPPPAPDGQRHGPPGGPGGWGGNPERRTEMLQKRLNLSTDQTAQLKTIFGEERTKTEALRSNASLSREDRRSQMMAIHEDGETRLHALLTPDQKSRYDDMEARMRERTQDGRRGGPGGPPRSGGDGPPPPPPPSSQE
jgi:periplasmic protein CpxP/Spy